MSEAAGAKRVSWTRVGAYLLAWAVLMIVWTSPSYVACQKEQADKGNAEHEKESAPGLIGLVGGIFSVEINCTGVFVDDNANGIIAVFTIVLAISTILLWRETERLAEGSADQARQAAQAFDLARKEFIATHRPKVVVRSIQADLKHPGGIPKIYLTIANTGATEATIVRITAGVGIKTNGGINWLPPGIKPQEIAVPAPIMVSGQRLLFTVPPDGARLGHMQVEAIGKMEKILFVLGEIEYRDSNNMLMHTGFIRVYDTQFGRFQSIEALWASSELEYAD